MTTLNPAAAVNTQAHETSKWDAMYRSRIGETYPAYCRQQYRPFLDVIRSFMRTGNQCVVREEGCGIGTITKILAQDANPEKVKFVAFDYDAAQVKNTRVNLHNLPFDVTVYQGDHFEMQGQVEIIHAHGVLEHFSDEEIHKVLNRQCQEASIVVHYVPLIGWGAGSYGDERLMDITEWHSKFKPDGVQLFNGGRDAAMWWYGDSFGKFLHSST